MKWLYISKLFIFVFFGSVTFAQTNGQAKVPKKPVPVARSQNPVANSESWPLKEKLTNPTVTVTGKRIEQTPPKGAADEIEAQLQITKAGMEALLRDLRAREITEDFTLTDYRRIVPQYNDRVEQALIQFENNLKSKIFPKIQTILDNYNSLYLSTEFGDDPERKKLLLDRNFTIVQNELKTLSGIYQAELVKLVAAQGDIPYKKFENIEKSTNSLNWWTDSIVRPFKSMRFPEEHYLLFTTYLKGLSTIDLKSTDPLFFKIDVSDSKKKIPEDFSTYHAFVNVNELEKGSPEFIVSGGKTFSVVGKKAYIEALQKTIAGYELQIAENNNQLKAVKGEKYKARLNEEIDSLNKSIAIQLSIIDAIEQFFLNLSKINPATYRAQGENLVFSGCESQLCGAFRMANVKDYIDNLEAKLLMNLEFRTLDNRKFTIESIKLDRNLMDAYLSSNSEILKFPNFDSN